MITIGLTGSIGMGKTETAKLFSELGVPVFDSDAVVHQLMGIGGEAVEAVEAEFSGVKQDGKTVTEDEKNMTSRWLEEAICPYDDLVNTSIILQYGNNFLDLDPNKKKECLCRLWGLDVISLLMKRLTKKILN